MPKSDKWVRVTQPDTGHHISIAPVVVASDPAFKVHQRQTDAALADGRPRPPKYRTGKGPARIETAPAPSDS